MFITFSFTGQFLQFEIRLGHANICNYKFKHKIDVIIKPNIK